MKTETPQHLQPPGLLITGFDIIQSAIRMISHVLIEYKGCMIS